MYLVSFESSPWLSDLIAAKFYPVFKNPKGCNNYSNNYHNIINPEGMKWLDTFNASNHVISSGFMMLPGPLYNNTMPSALTTFPLKKLR
jgi:hypothetical protein